MIPLALDLISTFVVGSIFPVATTERARSMRATFTSFSGSILGELRPMAFSETKAAPPSSGTTISSTHTNFRLLPFLATWITPNQNYTHGVAPSSIYYNGNRAIAHLTGAQRLGRSRFAYLTAMEELKTALVTG